MSLRPCNLFIGLPALSAACLLALPAFAQWKAVEKVAPYPVAGTTPPEIYFSIGERGPRASIGRAIAHTDFRLTWKRDYVPRDGGCTLASARPNLTITYTLPEPADRLPEPVRRHWDVFAAGIAAHEKIHGAFIIDMVREIEAVSVGMHVPQDPSCKKIRAALQQRLAGISQRQRQRSRDFDRDELSPGGKVHQLILTFVNAR